MKRAQEIAAWVRRVNALARKLDDATDGVHPSAWPEITDAQRLEYRRVAGSLAIDELAIMLGQKK